MFLGCRLLIFHLILDRERIVLSLVKCTPCRRCIAPNIEGNSVQDYQPAAIAAVAAIGGADQPAASALPPLLPPPLKGADRSVWLQQRCSTQA